MGKNGFVIGYCHPDDVSGWFCASLVNTLRADFSGPQRIKDVIAVRSGPMVERARNDIVNEFRTRPSARKADWLLMVDADMRFNYGQIRQLLDATDPPERSVVGGLCFSGDGEEVWPTMLVYRGPDDGFSPVARWPENTLCRVDATGCAFLLIHRSVLDKMADHFGPEHPAPWFATSFMGKRFLGEDVTFCMRLTQIGVKVWVHTGVVVDHMKIRPVNADEYMRSHPEGATLERISAEAIPA